VGCHFSGIRPVFITRLTPRTSNFGLIPEKQFDSATHMEITIVTLLNEAESIYSLIIKLLWYFYLFS
jgi:hypothetical protein